MFRKPAPASSPAARVTFAQRMGQALAAIMVIIIGLQVAWWGWRFSTPIRSAPSALEGGASSTDFTAARRLLGEPTAVAAPTAPSVATSNIRVKGVYAATGKTPSAAVINTGGRDTVVRIDEKIAEGVTLVEVHADRIVVSRGGVRETIALDLSAKVAVSGAAQSLARPSAQPQNVPGFRLNVTTTGTNGFALSRNELNSVLQDPRQLDHLGRVGPAPSGGVRIDDAGAGSLAQKLGLRTGDVIVSLNGQPVTGPGDLAKFYGQFSTMASIRAEVRRDGAPVLLNYAIQQ